MYFRFSLHALSGALLLTASSVGAQTVTVSKTTSADYNTISAALASFSSDSNSAPNVVSITDSSIYEETIDINTPVTVEGISSTKPTMALLANALGFNGRGGIVVDLPSTMTTGSVVLRNMNIIPSLATTGSLLLSAVENKNNNLFLELDKVIIAPNDGTSAPLVTNAFTNRATKLISTNPDFDPKVTQFGNDGVILGRAGSYEGAGVELLLKDTVISHFRGDLQKPTATSADPDCVVMATDPALTPPPFRLTRVEGSGGLSYARVGLNLSGDLEMKAPGNRINLRGHSLYGVFFGNAGTEKRIISDTVIDGVSQYALYDNGLGNVRPTIRDSIFYYFGRGVLFVKKATADTAPGDMLIENSTLVDGRTGAYHSFRWEGNVTTNIILRNSIFGGKYNQPATNGNNVLWFSTGTGATVTIEGCGVITTGPLALRPNPFASTPTNLTSMVNSDPGFVSNGAPLETGASGITYYPEMTDFMNVSNSDYANAADMTSGDGVTSAPLGGGAQYVGPHSAVEDWSSYSTAHDQTDSSHDVGLQRLIEMNDSRRRAN